MEVCDFHLGLLAKMSRNAVFGEHLAIAAHLRLVNLTSKPSSSLWISFTCRSLSASRASVAKIVSWPAPVLRTSHAF